MSLKAPNSLSLYILWALLLVLFILSVLTPFAGDVLLAFGGAFQADYVGDFPQNVYELYNIRGIGYKYFVYLIYKLGAVFSSDLDGSFPYVVRTIYYGGFLGICYASLYEIRNFLARQGLSYQLLFLLLGILTLSHSQWVKFQPSELCTFLTVPMIAFAFSEKKYLNYASGIFLFLLLTMKGITVVYAGIPFLLLLAFYPEEKDKLIRFVISGLGFLVFSVLFYLWVIPQEVEDILMSTQYQSSFAFHLGTIKSFILRYLIAISHNPEILLGPLALGFSILVYNKDWKKWIIPLAIFVLSSLYVLIQHKFFAYHYAAFSLFSVLALVFAFPKLMHERPPLKVGIAALIFFGFFLMNIYLPILNHRFKEEYANYFFYKEEYYDWAEAVGQDFYQRFQPEQEEQILTLYDGALSYFVRNPSYLDYFCPVPIQRSRYNPALRDTDIFKEQYAKMMDYEGRYIIWQRTWVDPAGFPEFEEKLANEYEVAKIYEHESLPKRNYHIYQRK